MLLVFGFSTISGCGITENWESDRGRGDTELGDLNQDSMDLALEMADGYLNVGVKCVGPTAYFSSTKGDGNAGSLAEPQFMDPYCLGVFDTNGNIDQAKLAAYIRYQSAVASGNSADAINAANELLDLASASGSNLKQPAPNTIDPYSSGG